MPFDVIGQVGETGQRRNAGYERRTRNSSKCYVTFQCYSPRHGSLSVLMRDSRWKENNYSKLDCVLNFEMKKLLTASMAYSYANSNSMQARSLISYFNVI